MSLLPCLANVECILSAPGITDIKTYLFSFQKKLINHEEQLLREEELSPYPQIQEIIQAKAPFDQLWRTIVSFSHNQEKWMNGPILSLNAEGIDEEVVHSTCFDSINVVYQWSSLIIMLSNLLYEFTPN